MRPYTGTLLSMFLLVALLLCLPSMVSLPGEDGQARSTDDTSALSTAPSSSHVGLSTLSEGGYQSYLSAELLPRPDPDAAAEATVRHMRQLVPATG